MKMIDKNELNENGVTMAWNEPGGSDGDKKDSGSDKDKSADKDPWGNRKPDNEQGPPDLDQIVKDMQGKVTQLFGGKRKSGGGGSEGGDSSGDGAGGPSPKAIGILAGVIFLLWMATGIYIVEPAERGVVLRMGNFIDTTGPGPHWRLPFPFDRVEIVDIDQIRNVEVGYRSNATAGRDSNNVPQESLMLTQDENIVDIKFAVQYRVKSADDYLFSVRNPDTTLRQATESAIREAIGKSKMDFVLTQGQSDIANRTKILIQDILDRYETGLIVTSVNLQSAQPPEEVRDAFEDAIRAREDQQRLINNAEAYSNDIIPKARGNAARQLEEANGYEARVIAQAEGEASRFSQLLVEYTASPEVTRERLYLDTIEEVMKNTTKVMIDVEGGNNLLYLPLDKLMGQDSSRVSNFMPQQFVAPPVATQPPVQRRLRDSLRDRGGR